MSWVLWWSGPSIPLRFGPVSFENSSFEAALGAHASPRTRATPHRRSAVLRPTPAAACPVAARAAPRPATPGAARHAHCRRAAAVRAAQRRVALCPTPAAAALLPCALCRALQHPALRATRTCNTRRCAPHALPPPLLRALRCTLRCAAPCAAQHCAPRLLPPPSRHALRCALHGAALSLLTFAAPSARALRRLLRHTALRAAPTARLVAAHCAARRAHCTP